MNDSGTVAAPTDATVRTFRASDGYEFRYRHWTPLADRPRGYVVALHGIQSHSGWYTYSSGRLCEAGFDVRFLDRRGAGLNDAERADAPHAERLVNDVAQVLSEVRWERDRVAPDAPVILQAVSWGGKLGTAVCGLRPDLVDGLAILYPGLRPRIRPTWWQDVKLRLAMLKGWGDARVPIPLDDPQLFTDLPEWQTYIARDELALHVASVQFLSCSRALDRLVNRVPNRIRQPTLLMLAGRDRIIDNDRTRRYFDRVAATDKRLIEYPNAAHTLEFEPDRDAIIADLVEWLHHVAER